MQDFATSGKRKRINKRRAYISNLIMMFVLAVSIIIAALAWFINSSRASINSIEVDSAAANSVELRVMLNGMPNAGDYDSGWVSGTVSLQDAVGTFKYANDITGNGILFSRPMKSDGTANPLFTGSDANANWQLEPTPAANKDYEVIDVYVRCNQPSNVYLTSSSSVFPVNKSGNRNEYGVSKDYIAGASRVAFVDVAEDNSETLSCVWIPNSKYQIDSASKAFTENGLPEGTYKYYDSSLKKIVSYTNDENLFKNHSYTTSVADPVINNGLLSNKDSIIKVTEVVNEIDKDTNNGFQYQSHFRIKIWIEGTDRETDSVFKGGVMGTDFKFLAVEQSKIPNT